MKKNTSFYSSILFLIIFNQPVLADYAAAETVKPKDIIIQDGTVIVTRKDASHMLEDMTDIQREKVLSDKVKFKNTLLELITLRKKAQAAKDKNLDKTELMHWRINKLSDQMLAQEHAVNFQDNLTLPDNIEQLAKEYYDSHPEQHTVDEKISVAHILFSTMNIKEEEKEAQQAKAKKVLKDIKGGLDFSVAAKESSDDTGSAENGGKLELFSRGKMVKAFEEAAFSIKNKGDLSEVVESQYGYHIIKLLDREKSYIKPFAEVKTDLISAEENSFRKKKNSDYTKSFGITKQTEIYSPVLDEIFKKANQKYN